MEIQAKGYQNQRVRTFRVLVATLHLRFLKVCVTKFGLIEIVAIVSLVVVLVGEHNNNVF